MVSLFLVPKMTQVDIKLLNKISTLLNEKKITVATAESCTGGFIAHTLTNISGSSNYFDRGIISYSNNAKNELLNVPKELLKEYGAVSEPVAKAMAEGIRKISNSDIGLSTTGIAGPTGGTKEKPVGLVYIGLSTKKDTIVKKFRFNEDRIGNKIATCNAVLNLLYEYLDTM
jgi:nicotinamide-nucleotide amidase